MDGLSSLGVTCSPREPRIAGSNTAEVDEAQVRQEGL